MLEGFRRKVGLSYSRLHFRNSHDRMMNFTNALSKSHKALVIFPESSLDSESVSTFFRYIIRKFSSEKVTVLIRDNQLFAMSSAPPLKTLIYSLQDINTWFVPRRKLLQKMEAKSFDVAFDLNIDLSLPSAFLCKASNAPLRVSFAKQNGDQFYNFQIKTKETTSKTHSYRSLLKCLDMF
jgi:ADP-heptose:LPS heptosyltransferase